MHTKPAPEPPDPTKNYEVRDLPYEAVAKYTTYFFVFVLIMGGAGNLSLKFLGGHVAPPAESPYATRRPLPAKAPILQDNASNRADLYNLRERENVRLHSNGNDPTTGKPYISIDDAIQQEGQAHP